MKPVVITGSKIFPSILGFCKKLKIASAYKFKNACEVKLQMKVFEIMDV
jgi:hypothetical protein